MTTPGTPATPQTPGRATVPALFIASCATEYAGAAIAVSLFATLGPHATAWWRVTVAAATLIIFTRPWKQTWNGPRLAAAATYGIVIAAMNQLFYTAIDKIPLGTAVSIEFTGPVILAAIAATTWRVRSAAALALAGVVSISGFGLKISDGETATGILYAAAAGALWALYIVIGKRISAQNTGLAPLGVGLAFGALAVAPFAHGQITAAWSSWQMALAVVAVGIASTVVPYGTQLLIMRWRSAAAFAVLLSLAPAISLVIQVAIMGVVPTAGELVGLALISVAVAVTNRG